MPIYEFKCRRCGKSFDQLCRIAWEGTVKCPECGDFSPSKVVSSVYSPGSGGGSSNCSSCSGTKCSGCK